MIYLLDLLVRHNLNGRFPVANFSLIDSESTDGLHFHYLPSASKRVKLNIDKTFHYLGLNFLKFITENVENYTYRPRNTIQLT